MTLSKYSEEYRQYLRQRGESKAAHEFERQGRIIAQALAQNFESVLQANQAWAGTARAAAGSPA